MKRILSSFLSLCILTALVTPAFADEYDISAGDTPVTPQTVYDVLNEDGVLETQEIYSLNEDGTLPGYITNIEYFDDMSSLIDNPEYEVEAPILEEIAPIEPAAVSATKYEREPNNTSSLANIYNDNENMYGTIDPAGDVDWYKVYWDVDGKVDFSLKNIPSGCNYDLKVFSQPKNGGSLSLYQTAALTGNYEKLTAVPVTNDKNYYMHIYSSKGTSKTQYLLNAKITRTGDSFEPNDTFNDAKQLSTGFTANGTIHKRDDVDYYKVSVSNGVLTVRLYTIPSGTDYRFAVYNSSKNLVYETNEFGAKEKNIDLPVANGTYYIKVYSNANYSISGQYTLKITHRSPQTKVTGRINPMIKRGGGESEQATPISDLPIKIVYTTAKSTTEKVLTSTTTNSSGNFTASFSLPSDVKNLYVKIYPDDSTLSVQTLEEELATSKYEIPYNAASISMTVDGTTVQEKATLSLWRIGKEGLAQFKSITGRSPSKLKFHCTGGKGNDTNYNSSKDRIVIAGNSTDTNYYDRDIIYHEMGHWEMYHNGATPREHGGTHNWSTVAASAGTAYSEGWAHYFSSSMRNNSFVRDYNSSGAWFGGNLSNGYIKPGYGGTLTRRPDQQKYNDNARMEINVGSTLWNIDGTLSKTFRDLDSLSKSRSNDFTEYYTKFMNSLSASQRESAWTTFNDFGVAFDMAVPTVQVSVSGYTATMSASDNVAVKRHEWYIDNKLCATGTGDTSSIDLALFSTGAGTHTVECRVYDPEGLATSPVSRPRTERYGTDSKTFVITESTPAEIIENPSIDDIPELLNPTDIPDGDMNDESVIQESEDTDVNFPSGFESNEGTNRIEIPDEDEQTDNELHEINVSMPHYSLEDNFEAQVMELYPELAHYDSKLQRIMPGATDVVEIIAPGNANLQLLCISDYAIKEYRIIAPDGSEYDSFNYMSAGSPYTIENAEPGVWSVEFENYTKEDMLEILDKQGISSLTQEDITASPATVDIAFQVQIDARSLEIPDITNNAYILRQLNLSNVDIYEGGVLINKNAKLEDGMHELEILPKIGNTHSGEETHSIIVDTVAPTITLSDVPTETNRDRFVLYATFSEDIAHLNINDNEYDLGTCQRNALATCIYLVPGQNTIRLSFTDYAENWSEEIVSVSCIGVEK